MTFRVCLGQRPDVFAAVVCRMAITSSSAFGGGWRSDPVALQAQVGLMRYDALIHAARIQTPHVRSRLCRPSVHLIQKCSVIAVFDYMLDVL